MKRKSLKNILLFFLFVALSSACNSVNRSTDSTNSAKERVEPDVLIKQADELYAQREDLENVRRAIALLKRARSQDSKNFEVNWKLSRANYYLGKNTVDEKESGAAFKEGTETGDIAADLQPAKPDGYFWAGANLGGDAQKNPFSKGITSVSKIQERMNKVIELNPSFQGASAYDALAQIELATRLTGGKAEKALEYLEKALALEKNNSYIRLHLAETYLALNRKDEAKKQLEYLLKMQPDPNYLPEYKETAEQAEKLLETRFS